MYLAFVWPIAVRKYHGQYHESDLLASSLTSVPNIGRTSATSSPRCRFYQTSETHVFKKDSSFTSYSKAAVSRHTPQFSELRKSFQKSKRYIRINHCFPKLSMHLQLFASDLDGTLLTPQNSIDPGNAFSIHSAIQKGLRFIPATGKSRSGAIRAMGALGQYLSQSTGGGEGIYLNGLLVYGNRGEIIHEQTLSKNAVMKILSECEHRGLTILLYSGDFILVKERTKETDMFIKSHEPIPRAVGTLLSVVGKYPLHKALLVSSNGDVRIHRNSLGEALLGLATITQARRDVLEVLPVGANKGTGLSKILDYNEVRREYCTAIGDGENDIEMILHAGLGIAVRNAVPELLEVADVIVGSNEEGGVSQALHHFFS